jgi:hypothetical protein
VEPDQEELELARIYFDNGVSLMGRSWLPSGCCSS